jgi:rod shape-determining protein MreD
MALKVYGMAALPRVNSSAARLLPIVTMLIAAIITILPVRVPGYAALTPAFTLMAVYHWTIYRPDLLPSMALFAVGLLEDLLTGAPVGVGALVLLLARAAVLRFRRYFVNRAFPFVWSGFTLLAGIAMLALWALHSAIDLTLLDLRSTVFRTVLTIAMFPVASFLLGRAQRRLIGAARLAVAS